MKTWVSVSSTIWDTVDDQEGNWNAPIPRKEDGKGERRKEGKEPQEKEGEEKEKERESEEKEETRRGRERDCI